MNRFRTLTLSLAASFLFCFLTSAATAQQGRNVPFRFGHKPATPMQKYAVTKDAGPWMIFCANFAVQDDYGKKQAIDLVKELRGVGLNAYIYEHSFKFEKEYSDLGHGFQKRSKDDHSNIKKKMKLKNVRDYTDVSVLVGDFRSKDDPNAIRRLAQLKQYRPRSLNYNGTRQRNSAVREYYNEINNRVAREVGSKNPKANYGPMGAAFLAPNPLLPESAYTAIADSSFLVKVNSRSKHSLLNCKKKYTVRVATFKGQSFLNDKKIEKEQTLFQQIISGRKRQNAADTTLFKGGIQAEELAEQLSRATSEAYVYHDRGSSIVCVGSFDWVVKGTGANKIVNPKVQRVIDYFKAKPVVSKIPGVPSFYKPKQYKTSKKGVLGSFDIVPVAVEVPQLRRR